MQPDTLDSIHEADGAVYSEYQGRRVTRRFSDPIAEAEAARTTCAVFDLTWMSLLRLTGEERASFLHGMSTNHVLELAPGQAHQNTLCDARGHLVAVLDVWNVGDALWADLHPGCEEPAVSILEKHLIMEDVEIAEVHSAWGMLSVVGPMAADAVREAIGFEAPQSDRVTQARAEEQTVYLVGSRRSGLREIDLVAPRDVLPLLWTRLRDAAASAGGRTAGFDALNLLRLEAGIPWWGDDLDDSVLMLEAGLDNAIHFKKGCYLGQETLARVHFRGHTNRQLTGLRLPPGDLPVPGTALLSEARNSGRITSSVHSPRVGAIALGFVRRELLAPGTLLDIEGRPGHAEVTRLPFVPGAAVPDR